MSGAQSESAQHAIHGLHSNSIYKHVGRTLVTHCNHQRRQVAQCNTGNSRSETKKDVAARHQVIPADDVLVSELQLALLGLVVKLSEDGNLDGTRLRHDLIAINVK